MTNSNLTRRIEEQARRAKEDREIGLVRVSGMRPMLPLQSFTEEQVAKALDRANEREAQAVVLRLIEDKRGYSVLYGRVLTDGKKAGVVQICGPEGDESAEFACSCGLSKQGKLCYHLGAFLEAINLQGEGELEEDSYAYQEYTRFWPEAGAVTFPESQLVYDALLVAAGISWERYQSM